MGRILFLLLAAASTFGWAAPEAPRFIAHRGMAQQFPHEGLARDGCSAARIFPPTHGFLENTIASMRAAFDAGAEQVELDIHPTADGQFVVFHDWTVDCRTQGHGVTRELTTAYLKSLDIGYGYTADNGATFPFRGRFIGAMPTWAEVMEAFPDRRFLVNIKSNDRREGAWIAAYAEAHRFDLARLTFYGGDRPIAALRELWPEVRTMSRATLKACAWRHLLVGWSGYVPEACRHSILFVPVNLQAWVWGWPERFVARMGEAGSDVTVIGPVGSGSAGALGIDDAAMLDRIPAGFRGFVSTDRIDVLGPRAKR